MSALTRTLPSSSRTTRIPAAPVSLGPSPVSCATRITWRSCPSLPKLC